MKLLQALKRITDREIKKIKVEEKALDEKRSRIQKALDQSKTACEGMSPNEKIAKGLYWTGWRVNAIETPTMIAGQDVANVRFMGIMVEADRVRPFEYQETLTNKEKQVEDMQRITADIKEKLKDIKHWYPIILTRNPYYNNYIEDRIK